MNGGIARTLRFARRELGRLLGIFLLGSVLVFLAVQAMPEDPIALRVKNPDPVRVAAIRADLGLDDPLLQQYGRYLADFARGDWGASLVSGRP
ncbi:MAG: ABC transporter permease, partial [Opitutales bacterium]